MTKMPLLSSLLSLSRGAVWILVLFGGCMLTCSATQETERVSRAIETIYPPRIVDVSLDYIIIRAGETLAITCKGRHPLRWNFTKNAENRSQISESVDMNGGKESYQSVFHLENASFADTGYITCYYDGTKDHENLANTTSIYVFVYDPQSLFRPVGAFSHELVIHPIYQHQDSVIPCRTTHPNVNVTLFKDSDYLAEATQVDEVDFDSREGFRIRFSNIYFNGQFHCLAVYENFTQNMTLHLMWFPDTTGPPKPHIDDSGNHVILNGSFTLTCIASIESATMLFMNWTYPNKGSVRIVEGNTTAVDKTSNNGYVYREVTRNLTVRNAQMSDQGTYTCTVTDHTDKKSSTDRHVKVYDHICHVNLTTDIQNGVNVIASKEDKVRFVVRLEAHPTPTVVWQKGVDIILPSGGAKYVINTSNTNTTLIIKNPQRSDNGIYKVTASVCDKLREIPIPLTVFEEPQVTIKSAEPFYVSKTKATLNCIVEGYPRPLASWLWRPCTQPECDSAFRPLETHRLPNKEHIIDIDEPTDLGMVKSTLTLVANRSGFYRCMGTNTYGKAVADMQFIVSDYLDGFSIKTDNADIVETMPFVLRCGASIFSYSDLKWQWRPNREGYGFNDVIDQSDIRVVREDTQNSLVLTLKFSPIRRSNSGLYKCTATERSTAHTVEKEHPVIVKAIEMPQFTSETNMNGSIVPVSPDELVELVCKVKGVPEPHVSWWKDGQLLNNGRWREFSDNATHLHIKRVQDQDRGLYSCRAENLGGIITTNVTLDVQGANVMYVSHDPMNEFTTGIVIGIIVAVVIVVILLGVIIRKCIEERQNQRELEMISQMLFEQGDLNCYNPDLPLDDQVELLPYDKRWEFPKERLKLGKTLGQGAFGRVVKAEAIGLQDGEASTTVAVKMLKERADLNQKKALMQELKVMIHLGRHLNVVNLLGAVTRNIRKGELLVIVEYCRFGNLRHFLLSHRDNFINQIDPHSGKINPRLSEFPVFDENSSSSVKVPETSATNHGDRLLRYADLNFSSYKNSVGSGTDCDVTAHTDMSVLSLSSTTGPAFTGSGSSDYLTCYKSEVKDRPIATCDLLCSAFQVARGMEYLASRKLVHRDLAARNILMAEDNVVKICDFGLAKDLYKYSNYKRKGDGPLPIKWMALESIRDKVFSSQSDVWSFGVVLWEFFTLGGNPYPGIEIDEEFYKKLKTGYRMDIPEFAPYDVYDVMNDCWRADPRDRPTFTDLVERLGNQLGASIRKYYVDLNNPYVEMNDSTKNNNDYLTMANTDDPHYINVAPGPGLPDYVNVPSKHRLDSDTSEYLSMQSPDLPTPEQEVFTPFPHYDNVPRKFRFDSADSNALELQPVRSAVENAPLLSNKNDPWVLRTSPVPSITTTVDLHCPVSPSESDYLYMGNRGLQIAKKASTDSANSDSSSGFHSDCADNSAPPSYSVVTGRDEYSV